MLKFKHEFFAYSQLVIHASGHLLPYIMEYIIRANGINIIRKKGL